MDEVKDPETGEVDQEKMPANNKDSDDNTYGNSPGKPQDLD